MDWFRRNWPDLLIGIALVAVIAGIIATLITGGSFFPVGQTTRTSTPPAQSATTQSAAPKPAATSPSSKTATGNQTSPGSRTSANAGGANGTTTTAPAGGNNGVSVLPPTANPPAQSATTAPSKTATAPAAAPANNGATQSTAATTSQNGPGSAAPYRISVGAFSHKDYAQRQEKVFKDAGYPVFLASQGDLTIVLVGPYKSQSEADQVAAKIKSGKFGVDPVVYHFQGTQDQAPSATKTGTTSATSSTAAPATSTAAPATAASGQRYLQVGAYDSAASAKPQRDRLTGMGFSVQERTENGLVKVLIGPFGPDRLQQVQAQLKAAGIDSFPR